MLWRAQLLECDQNEPASSASRPKPSTQPIQTRSSFSLLREPRWLTRERVTAWSAVLFAEQSLGFGVFLLWLFGGFGPSKFPISSDFVSFYAAGSLALSGHAAQVYDHMALWHAEQEAAGAAQTFNYFFYPPPFLFVCAVFGMFPYWTAFLLFDAVSLLLCLSVLRLILRTTGRFWYLPILAFPSLFWTLGLGQNSFLSAAIFGAGLLLIDRRPRVGGGMLALLIFKPHFGLLIPVALLSGKRWQAFAAATCVVSFIIMVSLLCFGTATWRSYGTALLALDQVYASGKIILAGYITPFGALRLVGITPSLAYLAQTFITVACASFIAVLWRGQARLAVRAAGLIAATLLSVPLALIYDFFLLIVCICWLVRDAQDYGEQPWEKAGFLFIYFIALISFFAALVLHLPLGPLGPVLIMIFCWRRVSIGKPAKLTCSDTAIIIVPR